MEDLLTKEKTIKICSVEGCSGKRYAKKLCRRHYRHIVEGGHKKPLPVIMHCKQCHKVLKVRSRSSGYCRYCYYKIWKNNNKEQLKQYKREYNLTNKEHILEQIKTWKKQNKTKINAYYANKRKDIQYKIAHNLRSRLYDALKNKVKIGSAVGDSGLTVSELILYTESLWLPGMTWENYGNQWSIDHIKPLCAFDLENREQFLLAVNYTNLQPLWNYEQFSKAAKDKLWKI